MYYSQYNQDRYLNENFFQNKKKGVFVDIGAYDGIEGSNTYFYEKELGWTGLCIEPIPNIYNRLVKNRTCKSVCAAAWKENTFKTFKLIDGYSEMLSGIVDCYDAKHVQRIDEEAKQKQQIIKDVEIKCLDINELLEKNKLFNIDFLSIDVEGSEYEILNHINFDLFNIEYIVAENNYKSSKLIDLMTSKGYSLVATLNIDNVFKKNFSQRKNNFKIVIPSFNNEEWCDVNIDSILFQTYKNYKVLYIDDASTDNTLSTVKSLVGDKDNWKIVSNPTNRRRGYNINPHNPNIVNFMESLDDILVFVDGDDWLSHSYVLEKLNDFYNEHQCWMTYGKFVCYSNLQLGNPQNTPYENHIHNNNEYRKDWWRASHLRTFKWWLYNRINEKDLKYSKTNDFYFHAEDLASSFPCLEMCPQNKIGVVDFVNYVFNDSPKNRERGVERENLAGIELETEIRNLIPYKKLTE